MDRDLFLFSFFQARGVPLGREREIPEMAFGKLDSFKTDAGKGLVSHPLGTFLGP